MTFWGLVVEPKKNYAQRGVEQPFHIAMAALDLQACDPNEPVSVVCQNGDTDFILCNLSKKLGILNVPLSLDIDQGSEINFRVAGNSTVHLTGYMMMEPFEDSDESMEEEEEEDSTEENVFLKQTKKMLQSATAKRKQDTSSLNESKKAKLEVQVDEEDEDDEDFDMEDGDSDDSEEEDDEEYEDEEDDEEQEEKAPAKSLSQSVSSKKAKQGKTTNQVSPAAKSNVSLKSEATFNKAEKTKQGKKEQAKGQTSNKSPTGMQPQANGAVKKVLEGGVLAEDLCPGHGPVAKAGKMVSVYYVGRLKNNNKQFDATTSGPGFRFRLGRKEVIRGWDVGVAGMKVGGKRRLTIPPKMAYGEKGADKVIPPNSTLVFDVELKAVN